MKKFIIAAIATLAFANGANAKMTITEERLLCNSHAKQAYWIMNSRQSDILGSMEPKFIETIVNSEYTVNRKEHILYLIRTAYSLPWHLSEADKWSAIKRFREMEYDYCINVGIKQEPNYE